MFFEFSNDKKFRRCEIAYAILNNFSISFMFSILVYAISNIIMIFAFDDFDVISTKYILFFVTLFAVAFSVLMLVFHKTDKGVTITEKEIVFSTGYKTKAAPLKTVVMRSDIVSVKSVENFSLAKQLKEDYRSYNYRWVLVGASSKNLSLVKIQAKDDTIYLLPIQDIKGFIKAIK